MQPTVSECISELHVDQFIDLHTLGEIIIPCLLSVSFDDEMHGIHASHRVSQSLKSWEENISAQI